MKERKMMNKSTLPIIRDCLKAGVCSDEKLMVTGKKLFEFLSLFEGFLPPSWVLPYTILKELVVNGQAHQDNLVSFFDRLQEPTVTQVDGHEIEEIEGE
jgi:hypothetical protein